MSRSILTQLFTAAILAFGLGSCSSVKVTGEWKNDTQASATPYDAVLVTSLLSDQTSRRVLEDAMYKELGDRGVKAMRGYAAYPDMYADSTRPDREIIYRRMDTSGTRAILTISLLDIDTNVQYVPGSVSYAPYPRYDWYGNFWGYYSYYYPRVYEPGYYTLDKVYYIEANLYDIKKDVLMWSAQTQTVNPKDLNVFADEFATTIVKKLVKQGLIPEKPKD